MQIKESLVFAFVVWMQIGGHSLNEKKGYIVMKRNGKEARISSNKGEYHEINDYCQDRYNIFLNHWLKGGVEFLNNLRFDGAMQVARLRGQGYVRMMK